MNEYIAEPQPQDLEVWELMQTWDGTNGIGLRRKLNALIKDNPHLITAYNSRCQILEYEDNLVALLKETKRAYDAVIEVILDDQGDFPESMPYGWLENRPCLSALFNYCLTLWKTLKWEEAESLMRQMLKMNPTDNHGVRFYLLAVLERMAYRTFLDRFPEDNDRTLMQWYEMDSKKFDVLSDLGF